MTHTNHVQFIAVSGSTRKEMWFNEIQNVGILITDHNVRETLALVDRAYIIHDGHVLMEGRPDAIVQNELVRKVYLGEGFKL